MKIVLALAAVAVLAACPRDDRPMTDTAAPGMAPAPTTTDPMWNDTLYRDTLRDTLMYPQTQPMTTP
jgi:hypothetical protein